MTDLNWRIQDVIEEARERLGLSYAEVAAALRVNEATLYRWRMAERRPTPRARHRTAALQQFLGEWLAAQECGRVPVGWLDSPLPAFGGLTPRGLLLAGRVDLLTGYLLGTGERSLASALGDAR